MPKTDADDVKLAPLVGHELRRLRESKPVQGRRKPGWSREYTAKLAGCSPGTVNNVETTSENATIGTLDNLCRALGTTLEDILCRILDRETKKGLLDRFRGSAWVETEHIERGEIDALLDLPLTKILGQDPTDRAIAYLILSRRNQK